MNQSIYIRAAKRTPIGSFTGVLASVPAPELAAAAIRALPEATVGGVILGNVLSAGAGQAPARQAALKAGLPESTPCLTLNKVCGSGMEAILTAARMIANGEAETLIAGGMESMSRAPHLLLESRKGIKLGGGKLIDSVVRDGLWDPYNDLHMGQCAETCATRYDFSREAQDAYAISSYQRAQATIDSDAFADEIAAVTIPSRKGDVLVDTDEGPAQANFEKVPNLRPAFQKDGTITAANASSLNDGAAALLVSTDPGQNHLGRLVAYASHAQAPLEFTQAPVPAIRKALDRAGWTADQVDLWEINEAFAVVPMLAEKELSIDRAKLNVNGGAIALGHPIGASGARIVVTLLHAMQQRQARRGVAALCIGGGEGLAICVERDTDS